MTARLHLLTCVLLAGIASLAGGVGCDNAGGGGQPVVATTTMLGDAAQTLLEGTDVEVVTLVKPGIDPHTYNLTAADSKTLENAKVVIANGLHLEGTMTERLEQLGRTKPVLLVGEQIDKDRLIEVGQGAYDPHVWMDVALWAESVVEPMASALVEQYPDNADTIRRNAEEYLGQLARLDKYAETAVRTIPENQRKLITAHDAFSYFGKAYGLEVRGIQGVSTESEAGVEDIRQLVDLIVTNEIPSVFAESSVSDKNVRALVEGAEARGHEVEVAPTIYSDSTGPVGTFEGTYLGMMDHNVTVITRALGGTADVHGLFGGLTLGHDHGEEEGHDAHGHDEHDHEHEEHAH